MTGGRTWPLTNGAAGAWAVSPQARAPSADAAGASGAGAEDGDDAKVFIVPSPPSAPPVHPERSEEARDHHHRQADADPAPHGGGAHGYPEGAGRHSFRGAGRDAHRVI